MKFDWTEFLNLATELAGNTTSSSPTKEAKQRAAVSRAYYSAYCHARNYIESIVGHPIRGGDAHRVVREQYINHKGATGKGIASELFRLHKDRKKADYFDEVNKLDKITADALNTAESIIESVNSL